jgi:phenylacetate-CoA ligase
VIGRTKSDSWRLLKAVFDVWRTGHSKQASVAALQQTRLRKMIRFVRKNSEFYAKLYNRLPPDIDDVRRLVPVAKHELMENFDDWVTDQEVAKASVEAFIADQRFVGTPHLGHYAVWTTSGTTGEPGIFIQNGEALVIYEALLIVRGSLVWMPPRHLQSILQQGGRVAYIAATGSHFVGAASLELANRRYPWLPTHIRIFSVLSPLPKLAEALNNFQPAIVISYPTAMELLAHEQLIGRLRINPTLIVTGGESLAPEARIQMATAFNCQVRDAYGASEFPYMAFDCGHGWLHVNSDWVILEPVDEVYQPVLPGQASRTVLLTNLANRVQPLIRYDLGDSITVSPHHCSCGSPLSAIRVEGRRNAILSFTTPDGEAIQLLPMTLAKVIEETPGVQRFQAIQTAPAMLSVRLETLPCTDSRMVWQAVVRRLQEYLSAQKLSSVKIEKTPGPPKCDPVSGKFRKVWTDL